MEVKVTKPAYYFSWPDEEILDVKLLEITGDDETWLYRIRRHDFNGHFQAPTQANHYHTPSGSVDSRTFTRRKHALRPSLESVVESPMSNRSSLDILSASRLNDTNLADYTTTPISTNQEKIFLSFTASDKAFIPRVFKLDKIFINSHLERKRHDSEISDSLCIPSLDSQFDKNEAMTDSMVNFLEKSNEKCQPPVSFQDEKVMTESLVSLSEKESCQGFSEKVMTDSMMSFLEPVACKPPSGFEDEEMTNSVVNLDDKDVLPASDMTNSLMDYLKVENITAAPTNLNETENIPPERLSLKKEEFSNLNHRDFLIHCKSGGKFNTTFEVKEAVDTTFNVEEGLEKSPEVTFTNSINISRTNKKETIDTKEDCFRRPLNTTFEKENEAIHKSRALNNKDLNVAQDLNGEDVKELSLSKFKNPNKTNSSALVNSSRINGTFSKNTNDNSVRLNGTFTKSDINSSLVNGTITKKNLNNTSNLSRKIPQRNSPFNTTFTKLDFPTTELSQHLVSRSTEGLDTGVEDDRTSSASDSSFSSAASSNKPRSVDELRSIAQQQESSLVNSSTPTEENHKAKQFVQLDLELSPIRRASLEGRRVSQSRSAHCSPVRSPLPHALRPHPISRLQQPITELRRQTLQASSLSNLTLTKPRTSGLRMPSKLVRPDPRPTTAPMAAPTAIPRPQASRLPMPRFRSSGIPTMKRGGQH